MFTLAAWSSDKDRGRAGSDGAGPTELGVASSKARRGSPSCRARPPDAVGRSGSPKGRRGDAASGTQSRSRSALLRRTAPGAVPGCHKDASAPPSSNAAHRRKRSWRHAAGRAPTLAYSKPVAAEWMSPHSALAKVGWSTTVSAGGGWAGRRALLFRSRSSDRSSNTGELSLLLARSSGRVRRCRTGVRSLHPGGGGTVQTPNGIFEAMAADRRSSRLRVRRIFGGRSVPGYCRDLEKALRFPEQCPASLVDVCAAASVGE